MVTDRWLSHQISSQLKTRSTPKIIVFNRCRKNKRNRRKKLSKIRKIIKKLQIWKLWICLKYEKLWNNGNHYTNCQFGYHVVTSCPRYLSIALYLLIPSISLFIPQNLISPCLAQVTGICRNIRILWAADGSTYGFEVLSVEYHAFKIDNIKLQQLD